MNADRQETAFATLYFGGDRLDPDVLTAALDLEPTFSVRRGETYTHGRRNREYVGRTGVWNLSTKWLVRSDLLEDHLDFLSELLTTRSKRLDDVCRIIRGKEYRAGVSCFWYGFGEACEPTISEAFRKIVARFGGEIETDFHREIEVEGQAAAE